MKILRIMTLILLSGAVFLGLGFVLLRALLPDSRLDQTVRHFHVGNGILTIPQAFLLNDNKVYYEDAHDSEAARNQMVMVAVFYPSFAPAGALNDITATTDLAARHKTMIFIALSNRNGELDPAERTVF